jgi:tricorn protease-like protein
MRRGYFALLATAALPASAAWAQADNATLFGTRESIQDISLSPDGNRFAVIQPAAGQGAAVYVVDIATGKFVRVTGIDGDPERLDWCRWVSNERLLCSIYAMSEIEAVLAPFSRLVAFNADGSRCEDRECAHERPRTWL